MEGTGATAIDSAFHFSYAYNRKDYSDWENRRITPPFPPISLPALKDDQTKLTVPIWLGAPGESYGSGFGGTVSEVVASSPEGTEC